MAVHKERVHWGNLDLHLNCCSEHCIDKCRLTFLAMDDSPAHSTEFVIMQFVSPHLNIKELSLPWLIRLCTKTENTESLCHLARVVSPITGCFILVSKIKWWL